MVTECKRTFSNNQPLQLVERHVIHFCSRHPWADDEQTMFRKKEKGFRNICLHAVLPNDADGSPRKFYRTVRTQRVTGRRSVQCGWKCPSKYRQYFVTAKCFE